MEINEVVRSHLEVAFGLANEIEPRAPRHLLEKLAEFDDPVATGLDSDTADSLHDAARQDLSVTPGQAVNGAPVSDQTLKAWAGIIRWLQLEISRDCGECQASDDHLVSILVVLGVLDIDDMFWPLFVYQAQPSHTVIVAAGRLIAEFTSQPKQAPFHSIGNASALDAFLNAEHRQLWPELDSPHIIDASWSSSLIRQAVRLLLFFAGDTLIRASNSKRDLFSALQVVSALPVAARFRFGHLTSSAYIQFAALAWTRLDSGNSNSLDEDASAACAALLIHMSNRVEHWPLWAETFCRYPVRYPWMQEALGIALARMSGDALSVWANTVELSRAPGEMRALVRDCLAKFGETSEIVRRRKLWTLCFQRWREWDFGDTESMPLVNGVTCSTMDFAVTSYALEVMTEDDRTRYVCEEVKKLERIEQAWHADFTSYVSAAQQILSRLQPIQHAQSIQNGEATADRLFNRVWLPVHTDELDYYASRWRLQHKSTDDTESDAQESP